MKPRDMTLENLVMSDQKKLQVDDFGIFKFVYLQKGSSVDYRINEAPETKGNKQSFTREKSDSWSIGVILFQLLFSRDPQFNSSELDFLSNKRSLTNTMKDFLRKLLCIDPNQRIAWRNIPEDICIKNYYFQLSQLDEWSLHLTNVIQPTFSNTLPLPNRMNNINNNNNNVTFQEMSQSLSQIRGNYPNLSNQLLSKNITPQQNIAQQQNIQNGERYPNLMPVVRHMMPVENPLYKGDCLAQSYEKFLIGANKSIARQPQLFSSMTSQSNESEVVQKNNIFQGMSNSSLSQIHQNSNPSIQFQHEQQQTQQLNFFQQQIAMMNNKKKNLPTKEIDEQETDLEFDEQEYEMIKQQEEKMGLKTKEQEKESQNSSIKNTDKYLSLSPQFQQIPLTKFYDEETGQQQTNFQANQDNNYNNIARLQNFSTISSSSCNSSYIQNPNNIYNNSQNNINHQTPNLNAFINNNSARSYANANANVLNNNIKNNNNSLVNNSNYNNNGNNTNVYPSFQKISNNNIATTNNNLNNINDIQSNKQFPNIQNNNSNHLNNFSGSNIYPALNNNNNSNKNTNYNIGINTIANNNSIPSQNNSFNNNIGFNEISNNNNIPNFTKNNNFNNNQSSNHSQVSANNIQNNNSIPNLQTNNNTANNSNSTNKQISNNSPYPVATAPTNNSFQTNKQIINNSPYPITTATTNNNNFYNLNNNLNNNKNMIDFNTQNNNSNNFYNSNNNQSNNNIQNFSIKNNSTNQINNFQNLNNNLSNQINKIGLNNNNQSSLANIPNQSNVSLPKSTYNSISSVSFTNNLSNMSNQQNKESEREVENDDFNFAQQGQMAPQTQRNSSFIDIKRKKVKTFNQLRKCIEKKEPFELKEEVQRKEQVNQKSKDNRDGYEDEQEEEKEIDKIIQNVENQIIKENLRQSNIIPQQNKSGSQQIPSLQDNKMQQSLVRGQPTLEDQLMNSINKKKIFEKNVHFIERELDKYNVMAQTTQIADELLQAKSNFWIVVNFFIIKKYYLVRLELVDLLETHNPIDDDLEEWESFCNSQEFKKLLDRIINENENIQKSIKLLQTLTKKRMQRLQPEVSIELMKHIPIEETDNYSANIFVHLHFHILSLMETLSSQSEEGRLALLKHIAQLKDCLLIAEQGLFINSDSFFNLQLHNKIQATNSEQLLNQYVAEKTAKLGIFIEYYRSLGYSI